MDIYLQFCTEKIFKQRLFGFEIIIDGTQAGFLLVKTLILENHDIFEKKIKYHIALH